MLIVNPISLVGDFLGTLPALIDFIRHGGKKNVTVICNPVVEGLANLLQEDVKSHFIFDADLSIDALQLDRQFWAERYNDYEMPVCLDLQRAFREATAKGLYMGAAYYGQLLRDVKSTKAELIVQPEALPFQANYVISPFSRSLPESQKIRRELWQELVDANPSSRFALIGTAKYDDPAFVTGPNVLPFFDHTWNVVGNLLKSSKAILSVVTGTSHFAFHIATRNILFTNQATAWGNNPDAIRVTKHIPDLQLADIQHLL